MKVILIEDLKMIDEMVDKIIIDQRADAIDRRISNLDIEKIRNIADCLIAINMTEDLSRYPKDIIAKINSIRIKAETELTKTFYKPVECLVNSLNNLVLQRINQTVLYFYGVLKFGSTEKNIQIPNSDTLYILLSHDFSEIVKLDIFRTLVISMELKKICSIYKSKDIIEVVAHVIDTLNHMSDEEYDAYIMIFGVNNVIKEMFDIDIEVDKKAE